MTHERDLERLLDVWLAEGSLVVSGRVIDQVSERLAGERQRPTWRVLERGALMPTRLRFAAAAAAVLLLLGAALLMQRLNPSSSFGGPTVAPNLGCERPFPSGVFEDLAECTYVTSNVVPLAIDLDERWRLVKARPEQILLTVDLPDKPSAVTNLWLKLFRLDRVVNQPCHAQTVTEIPSRLWAEGATRGAQAFWTWLADAAPMVTFTTPTPATIGRVDGLQARNITKLDAIRNACDGTWYVDVGDTGVFEDSFWFAEADGVERLTVLVVDGQTLLIDVLAENTAPAIPPEMKAFFPTLEAAADDVLATLEFRTGSTPTPSP